MNNQQKHFLLLTDMRISLSLFHFRISYYKDRRFVSLYEPHVVNQLKHLLLLIDMRISLPSFYFRMSYYQDQRFDSLYGPQVTIILCLWQLRAGQKKRYPPNSFGCTTSEHKLLSSNIMFNILYLLRRSSMTN